MEEALLAHPAVRYTAVIGTPDPERGELAKAIVTLAEDKTATADELLAHCQSLLGSQPTPDIIEFIDEMPMTATGKIGRAELQAREQAATT